MIHRRDASALFLIALGAVMLAMAGLARAVEVIRIDHVSHKPFEDTIRQLEWGFGGYGLTVVLQLDYQHVLQKIDVPIKRSRMVEIMRRPWGKTIFEHDPAAALDIPFRVYIYEREDGKTVVSYYQPSSLFTAYGKEGLKELGRELDAALQEIVHVATKGGLKGVDFCNGTR